MTTSHFFSSLKAFFLGLFLLFFASHLFFHASRSIAAGFSTHLTPIRIDILRFEMMCLSKIILGSNYRKIIWVVVSTGSNFNWVLCNPCNCYEHDATNFNPHNSKKLNCLDNQYCSSLPGNGCDDDNKCKYTFKFHDHSYIKGILSTEKLKLLSRNEDPLMTNFTFGCTHKTHGSFSRYAGGMIGLGRAPLSLVRQLRHEIFFYCLPFKDDSAGWLNFGPMDHAPDPGATTADLFDVESNLYNVMLKSMDVIGDHSVIIMSPQRLKLVIDTSTQLTYIDDATMKNLIDVVMQVTPYHPIPIERMPHFYDLCFDVSQGSDQLPWIKFFVADSAEVHLSPDNIFLLFSDTMMCLSILSNVRIGGELNILGSQAQMGRNIGVDLQNNKITFGQIIEC